MNKEPNEVKTTSETPQTEGNLNSQSEKGLKCNYALENYLNLITKDKRKVADDFLELLEESMFEAVALYIKHLSLFDTDPILRGYREEIEEKYKGDLKLFKSTKLLPLRIQLLESKLNKSLDKNTDNDQIAYADVYNEVCKVSPKSAYDLYESNSSIIDNNLRLRGVKELNWNILKQFYVPFEIHPSYTLLEKVNELSIYSKPNEEIGLDEEKVIKNILFIGERGCGKSSLINSMTTYLLGVNQRDSVRIKSVIEQKTTQISSYIIRSDPKRFETLVRFIDTPGLGVSPEQDKINSTAIWDYIVRYQYDLHGICFVIKTTSGLSQIQKYIIQQVKQLFGSEIEQNLLGLFTYAVDQYPTPDKTIEDSGLPINQIHYFNNAAFFPLANNNNYESNSSFTWEMAMKNCNAFFKQLSSFTPISLDQTKEVIKARNALEATAKSLQSQIDAGIKERKRLEGVYAELRKNEANIDNGVDFTYLEYYDEEIKHKKPPGEYTTNCINCHNMTCHKDCAIKDNAKKNECWAITKEYCRICPSKCHWTQHANLGYYSEIVKQEKELSWEETKHEYTNGFEGKLTAKRIFDNLTERMNKITQEVITYIHDCRANLEQLNTISLKGFNENITDYINIMIEVERKEKSPGYLERIKQIEEVRDKYALMDGNDLSAPNVVYDSESVKRMADDYQFKKNEMGEKKEQFKQNCCIF